MRTEFVSLPVMNPVVLVHGIWDSAHRLSPLTKGLLARGLRDLHALDLLPPWGNARLEVLAAQLDAFVEKVCRERQRERVDLVGFSMGALVSRVYLQLRGGARRVETFISISAPHHGTWMAYGLPLAGARQMRPGSPLLRHLEATEGALDGVKVHCLYTPFDLTIVPPRSGILRVAQSVHAIPVPVHRMMIGDARVHERVISLLTRR